MDQAQHVRTTEVPINVSVRLGMLEILTLLDVRKLLNVRLMTIVQRLQNVFKKMESLSAVTYAKVSLVDQTLNANQKIMLHFVYVVMDMTAIQRIESMAANLSLAHVKRILIAHPTHIAMD